METRNNGFKRSRILRIGFSACPKETSGHCFADHWAETTDALTFLYLSQKPFIFNHESTHFSLYRFSRFIGFFV